MRRALVIVLALAAGAAFVITQTGAGGDSGSRHFTVRLDNAFGLVTGADLKIAGVRAGKITNLRLDNTPEHHALVDFTVDKTGFGSLRTDTFCQTRPQSLIGEYFIDCDPGKAPKELPNGATIPITQTATTVPADLLNDIMRRPYRERLRIILDQLGVGVGARASELNDAIRRASPALRETDQVLGILGKQNLVLKDLVTNADTVLHDLAGNRADVNRWVREAHGTAAASAERRRQIAEGLQKLPGFLEQLQPAMQALGQAADAQTPALQNLNASADQLTHLLTQLKPFADSTRVNLRSLGGAAKLGRPALKAAQPVVAQLDAFSVHAPELANNLNIVLRDLDDRSRAVEKDPRSPGGQGYTGLEALMRYIFNQSQAINIYDSHGYILKANLFVSECSDYQNAKSLKAKMAADPGFYKRCASILGPNQLGVLQPDPTKPANTPDPGLRAAHRRAKAQPGPQAAPTPAATPEAAKPDSTKPAVDLGQTIQDLLHGKLPQIGLGPIGQALGAHPNGELAPDRRSQNALLDFLLAP